MSTLTICKDSFVSADKSTFYSDLLYRVSTTGNTDAFIYLLFEHKSNPDRFTALQLLRYMVEIWEQYMDQHPGCKTLPLILPMVLYHGKPRQEGIALGELVETPDAAMKTYMPDFAFKFFDFSPDSELELKGTARTMLFLLSLKAKNQPKKVELFRAMMEFIEQLDDSPESIEWIRHILYYAHRGSASKFDF